MFKTNVAEKIKIHNVCSVTFSRKSWNLWDNVAKYSTAGQATNDSTAHALCVLDNQGYRHTLRIYKTYCFSTATVVTRTRLDITFMRILAVFLNPLNGFVALRTQKNISCLQT